MTMLHRMFYYLHFADKSIDFQEKEITSLTSCRKRGSSSARILAQPACPLKALLWADTAPLGREAVELVKKSQLPQGLLP